MDFFKCVVLYHIVIIAQGYSVINAFSNLVQTDRESASLKETSTNVLIKLNVGGKEFETRIDTLTRMNNTYFTALLSKTWQAEIDDKGRVFIDRDGDAFVPILNYLRTGKFHLQQFSVARRLSLIDEAEFYQLHELVSILNDGADRKQQQEMIEKLKKNVQSLEVKFLNATELIKIKDQLLHDCDRKLNEEIQGQLFFTGGGTLLSLNQETQLNMFYGVKNQQWKLLYKASRDGFSSSIFHKLCDDKGDTMSIIKSSEGWLFGGFTRKSWSGSGTCKTDPKAFLFTLTNPHNITPTKFIINKDKHQYAICNYPSYGPTFGDGSDIYVSNDSNLNVNSKTQFPSTYMDSETGKGNMLFTGNLNFRASDIEVYEIVK